MPAKDLVFISCGQYTPEEKALGKAIKDLVDEKTPYEGYFAENVQGLDALSAGIFGALNRAVGLIAVMHPRGEVTRDAVGERPLTRGSVWIEQEFAIAAFIQQTLGRSIDVLPFLHDDIALEGVRQQLVLNPTRFTTDAEVLDTLRERLPGWRPKPERVFPVRILFDYRRTSTDGDRRNYELGIDVESKLEEPIEKYMLELELPRAILDAPESLTPTERDKARDTQTHVFIRRTPQSSRLGPLYERSPLRLFLFQYFSDGHSRKDPEILALPVRAKFQALGRSVVNEIEVRRLFDK